MLMLVLILLYRGGFELVLPCVGFAIVFFISAWVNVGVKAFGPLCERIRKMQLKEGSYINLMGRYNEDIWEDEKSKEKRSVPVIILEDIEYCFSGSSKNSGDSKYATSSSPEPANNYAAPPASDPMTNGFTGFQNYGGGSSFF